MYKHHQARKHQKADEDLTRILQCIEAGTLSTKEVERLGLAQQDRIHVRQILNLKMEQRVLQKRIKNHRGNESVKLMVSQILRLTAIIQDKDLGIRQYEIVVLCKYGIKLGKLHQPTARTGSPDFTVGQPRLYDRSDQRSVTRLPGHFVESNTPEQQQRLLRSILSFCPVLS
ncbi:hypothetical protein RRG08_013667 [Elysia crispata]|uniref:Uncharacterized protein n=1 Tax=Elysia crispata TaxID=231223 RepID=A0AAE1A3S5_9GAST|nr:hypothetical protein RRG08_013667 [Elysia crispata]